MKLHSTNLFQRALPTSALFRFIVSLGERLVFGVSRIARIATAAQSCSQKPTWAWLQKWDNEWIKERRSKH